MCYVVSTTTSVCVFESVPLFHWVNLARLLICCRAWHTALLCCGTSSHSAPPSLPPSLPSRLSVWQGDTSRRMRGSEGKKEKSGSPGCWAPANPDFMQCDTQRKTPAPALHSETSRVNWGDLESRQSWERRPAEQRIVLHIRTVETWHIVFVFCLANDPSFACRDSKHLK